jgi:hypothetical protein
MPIDRQRLGKHIPEKKLSTIEEHPLLGNGPVDALSGQQKIIFSMESVQSSYKKCSAGQ